MEPRRHERHTMPTNGRISASSLGTTICRRNQELDAMNAVLRDTHTHTHTLLSSVCHYSCVNLFTPFVFLSSVCMCVWTQHGWKPTPNFPLCRTINFIFCVQSRPELSAQSQKDSFHERKHVFPGHGYDSEPFHCPFALRRSQRH